MRVWLAVQCFFKLLFSADFARQVQELTAGKPPQSTPGAAAGSGQEPGSDQRVPAKTPTAATPTAAPPSQRSDAITLLATLQREARFVDIVTEPLDGYSDAQVGAAARDVLRDSGKVLDRLFSLSRVADVEEGNRVELPASYDTGKYRLTGNVSGDPPLAGRLVHAGWQATACELPAWTGGQQAALVIAPAEVQVS